MCDKKTSSIVHTQQAPVERVSELMTTAETELAAFYEAVFRRYGLKEAKKSAQDWIKELETMDWPADGALPNWHQVHYNTIRPHSSLGYRSPAPETWQPEMKTGYGEVESKVRFPLPHTLDGDEILTKINALH